jgi:acetyl-CoA C-acetyltransferase
MQKQFKTVAVLGGARTPFVRSFTSYMRITNQDLLTACLSNLATRYGLKGEVIGDVALGAVMHSSSDWNLTREAVLGSGLHAHTPGYNVQRACGTGLETTWQLALKVAAGQIESGIAGGSDTNSDLPILFPRSFGAKLMELRAAKSFGARLSRLLGFRLNDLKPQFPAVVEPRTGLSMGQHCEKMVQEWKITREAQDQLAFESHQKGAKAYDEGFYDDLVFEFNGVKKDLLLRKDTSIEKLAKLRAVFDTSGKGTLTAGNSTALTDGASVVLLGSEEYAKKKGLPVLAKLVDVEIAGVDFVGGAGLLMAPTVAVAKLLQRNGLKLQDFDFYEIHEAFAGQVLCTLKAWESAEYCAKAMGLNAALGSIDRQKMNVKGGSVAIGHPFGATGGRIVAALAKILHKSGPGKRGLISICTGGGMGIAAILES